MIIPTRNEAETICECIQRAELAFAKSGLEGEVIVADSSSDKTASIAASCGARVVRPEKLGYGNAYLAGFREAQGDFIVLMDGDLTYDPGAIQGMIALLQSGSYDMVMGSRLKGEILPGAMPALHRYIGNPILTWVLNQLFSTGISDAHCGLRAITREGLKKLSLKSGGMEFASEMVIEAASKDLRIAEVPITYYPRKGDSKLHSFTDGWRHLRFMMLYRPVPFLLVPGLLALGLGLVLAVGVYLQGGSRMHSMILGGLLLIIGYQMLFGRALFWCIRRHLWSFQPRRNSKVDKLSFPGKGADFGAGTACIRRCSWLERPAEMGAIRLWGPGRRPERYGRHDLVDPRHPDDLLGNVHQPAPAIQRTSGRLKVFGIGDRLRL